MKKLFIFFISLFLGLNVFASDILNEIDITYLDNALTKATRSYTNNRYIFDIEYIGDVTNLTSEQLSYALNQESSDYLTVFGNLNVKIMPSKNGVYKNIEDKIFAGISSGTFGNNIDDDVMPNDVANLNSTNFQIKEPIMEVYYRLNENSTWINDKDNLSGDLTLENQLANLLNIDLDTNPDGVKNAYKTLYYFKPYEDMTYSNRIDLYEATEQTSAEDPGNNEYSVDTLKKLSTEYGILRFKELTDTTFFENNNTPNILPYVILITLTLCGCAFYYLKSKKLI